MPQMSPLSWLILMFFFLTIMFMISMLIYNLFLKFINVNKMNNYMLFKNWKW
uniref:ATP synthase F0 subunit 8 n=1 Tax=Lagria rufipennis TaxID=1738060 RepID=UPI002176C92A|nr:ATP synthase F0 subunit 8 [Lagria rufipennis]UUL71642.1 ATP synthase F0 subunit 8 [Lagria rufipennis]